MQTEFHNACQRGDLLQAQRLSRHDGVDIHKRSEAAFLVAVDNGRADVVAWLLSIRPPTSKRVNFRVKCNMAIRCAAEQRHYRVCVLLLEKYLEVGAEPPLPELTRPLTPGTRLNVLKLLRETLHCPLALEWLLNFRIEGETDPAWTGYVPLKLLVVFSLSGFGSLPLAQRLVIELHRSLHVRVSTINLSQYDWWVVFRRVKSFSNRVRVSRWLIRLFGAAPFRSVLPFDAHFCRIVWFLEGLGAVTDMFSDRVAVAPVVAHVVKTAIRTFWSVQMSTCPTAVVVAAARRHRHKFF